MTASAPALTVCNEASGGEPHGHEDGRADDPGGIPNDEAPLGLPGELAVPDFHEAQHVGVADGPAQALRVQLWQVIGGQACRASLGAQGVRDGT